jgi:hypothetical protein
MSKFERKRHKANAHAQPPPCQDPANGRVTIKTVKPSRWPQNRGYGRRLLKQLQQQLKTHAKSKSPQRLGRAPMPGEPT